MVEDRPVGSAWRGRVFLGSGHMVYAGPVGPTALHSHHAFQLALTRKGTTITLRGATAGGAECEAALVPSDVPHAIAIGCAYAVMLYVDPDSRDGRRLRALHVAPDVGPDAWRRAGEPLSGAGTTDPPGNWAQAESVRRAMLDALLGRSLRPTPLHPALVRAIDRLPELLEARLRLGTLADELGISEGRLAHLFGGELGLPFRRYVAWLRLRRAAEALQAGETLASAAHHAGFADAAHFTRTFRRMFGLVPSEIARVVDWVVEPHASS